MENPLYWLYNQRTRLHGGAALEQFLRRVQHVEAASAARKRRLNDGVALNHYGAPTVVVASSSVCGGGAGDGDGGEEEAAEIPQDLTKRGGSGGRGRGRRRKKQRCLQETGAEAEAGAEAVVVRPSVDHDAHLPFKKRWRFRNPALT